MLGPLINVSYVIAEYDMYVEYFNNFSNKQFKDILTVSPSFQAYLFLRFYVFVSKFPCPLLLWYGMILYPFTLISQNNCFTERSQ